MSAIDACEVFGKPNREILRRIKRKLEFRAFKLRKAAKGAANCQQWSLSDDLNWTAEDCEREARKVARQISTLK